MVKRKSLDVSTSRLVCTVSNGSLAEISLKDRSLKSKTQITTEGDDVGRMILDVSPSGDYVAVSHGDGQLSLLDGSTKAIIRSWKLAGGVWNIEQHPECMVVSCMYGGWAMLDRILEPFYCERKPGDALLYGATICDQGFAYITFKDSTLTMKQIS
ncbi:unnamed protein product, partial [Mesorhabditis spiculigera]